MQDLIKTKKGTLQKERGVADFEKNFNQSAYTRNTTAFLGNRMNLVIVNLL
ncbi:hypothetical protein [Helicobacter bilis]|uniref:hypothetical protein n=1 Tax=Helicobacter bilis TaxID=37372 RepID=UPI00248ECE45|nr:hypothetical protein [Helicobacter bilis]